MPNCWPHWTALLYHSRLHIRIWQYSIQSFLTTTWCLGFLLLWYRVVDWQKGAPRLIWEGKRWLFCHTHEPNIANSEPWLDIFPSSSRMYEQTGIRKCITSIIGFDKMRRWLVDGLECSAPGRNRIWSVRTVQRRKFIAISSLYSLQLRVLKTMCE